MKETPILFNTEMVQAILQGRKTQTRRIIKSIPPDTAQIRPDGAEWIVQNEVGQCWVEKLKAKYKPGDLLWVKETWQKIEGNRIIYKANPLIWGGKWKPSIHMPKAAARIWLEITNIKVERLMDISAKDAIAEGINVIHHSDNTPVYQKYCFRQKLGTTNPILSFETLFASINGEQVLNENPWLWVITFKPLSHSPNSNTPTLHYSTTPTK